MRLHTGQQKKWNAIHRCNKQPYPTSMAAQNNQVAGFTEQHSVHMLVYFEQHEIMESAITREKQLKKWNREWKINLIEKENPQWNDLWESIQ